MLTPPRPTAVRPILCVIGLLALAGCQDDKITHSIVPRASEPDKTWPAERFVEVARHLRAANGLEPVFLAGPMDDTAPFLEFRVWRNAPLADVKSLMSGASLFVGNDSGPAHVAAAFGVPVVVLFGPSDAVTWAPWRTEAQVMTSRENIERIQITEVIAAAESLRVKHEGHLRSQGMKVKA